MYCPACAGFWVGGALGGVGGGPVEPLLWAPVEAAISACGLMALIDRWEPSTTWQDEYPLRHPDAEAPGDPAMQEGGP